MRVRKVTELRIAREWAKIVACYVHREETTDMLMECTLQDRKSNAVPKLRPMRGWSCHVVQTLLCCVTVGTACAQQTATAAALPNAPLSASVSGTVTDLNGGAVTDADVMVMMGTPEHTYTAFTDDKGHFQVSGLPAGDFRLTVDSEELQSVTRQGKLRAGEQFVLPQIVLRVASANTAVEVTASRADIAEAEIKVEEKQRVLGVIPNFYVTYNWHAEPLSSKQKYELVAHDTLDWTTFVVTGAVAGIQYEAGSFSGFGYGPSGYAKRYAADFGNVLFGNILGGALLPQIFRQDPRYFYKGTGTKRSRFWYALSTAVIARGDNGKWQPAYAGILGNYGAGAISNLYYPASSRNGVGLTLENGTIGVVSVGIGNVIQEFVVKHFTPTAKNAQQRTTN